MFISIAVIVDDPGESCSITTSAREIHTVDVRYNILNSVKSQGSYQSLALASRCALGRNDPIYVPFYLSPPKRTARSQTSQQADREDAQRIVGRPMHRSSIPIYVSPRKQHRHQRALHFHLASQVILPLRNGTTSSLPSVLFMTSSTASAGRSSTIRSFFSSDTL